VSSNDARSQPPSSWWRARGSIEASAIAMGQERRRTNSEIWVDDGDFEPFRLRP
jgi:hypothetical protein